MGGASPSLRLTGTLRLWSRPGVRLSLGTGDSTFGLKAMLLMAAAEFAFCICSAARDVTKPTDGGTVGLGTAFVGAALPGA